MKLERALETKNYQQILTHLQNGSDFSNISLVHLLDDLIAFNKAQPEPIEDLTERLIKAGALLTYQTLQQRIVSESKLALSPQHKKNLKRLYSGLIQLKDAWQANQLNNQADQTVLDQQASKKLLQAWHAQRMIPALDQYISQKIKEKIAEIFKAWYSTQLNLEHAEEINTLLHDNILACWQQSLTPFAASDILNNLRAECLIKHLKEERLPEEFNEAIIAKLKGDVVLHMKDYAELMELIIQEAADRNKRNKQMPTNMVPIYQVIFEDTLLIKWRRNLLSETHKTQMNKFLLDKLIDVKAEGEYKTALERQTVAESLAQFKSAALERQTVAELLAQFKSAALERQTVAELLAQFESAALERQTVAELLAQFKSAALERQTVAELLAQFKSKELAPPIYVALRTHLLLPEFKSAALERQTVAELHAQFKSAALERQTVTELHAQFKSAALERQTVAKLLVQFESKALAPPIYDALHTHLVNVLIGVFTNRCRQEQASMEWLVNPVIEQLLDEWKTHLAEEYKQPLNELWLQDMDKTLNNLTEAIYPVISVKELEQKINSLEEQYQQGAELIQQLNQRVTELEAKLKPNVEVSPVNPEWRPTLFTKKS